MFLGQGAEDDKIFVFKTSEIDPALALRLSPKCIQEEDVLKLWLETFQKLLNAPLDENFIMRAEENSHHSQNLRPSSLDLGPLGHDTLRLYNFLSQAIFKQSTSLDPILD